MATNSILFVIANKGYQPVEYAVPKKLLEQAGFHIITASNKSDTATASDNTQTEVDLLISDANAQDYDGIFFVGGPGALENLDNQASYDLLNAAVDAGKIVGAICIAPRILARAGILDGKRATGWNDDNEIGPLFKEHNVNYVPNEVIVDGKIITAIGPNASREFGEQIISLLQN